MTHAQPTRVVPPTQDKHVEGVCTHDAHGDWQATQVEADVTKEYCTTKPVLHDWQFDGDVHDVHVSGHLVQVGEVR